MKRFISVVLSLVTLLSVFSGQMTFAYDISTKNNVGATMDKKDIGSSEFLSEEVAEKFVKLFYSQSSTLQSTVKSILTGKKKGTIDEIKGIYNNAVSFFKLLDKNAVEMVVSKGAAVAVENISSLTNLVSGVMSIYDNGKSFVNSTNAMQKTVDGLQIFSSTMSLIGCSAYIPSSMSIVLSSTEFALALGGYLEKAYFKENATLYQYELEIAYQTDDEIPYRKAPKITIGSGVSQEEADSIFSQLYIEYCVKRMLKNLDNNGEIETASSNIQYSTQPTTNDKDYDKVYSGVVGDCNWKLNTSSGELVITGTGKAVLNDDVNSAPWESLKNNIKIAKLEKGVNKIGEELFYECNNLENVIFSDTLIEIEPFAFNSCDKLVNIYLPKNVEKFYGNSFFNCNSIEHIYLDKENQNYIVKDDVLYDKNKTKLIYYCTNKRDATFVLPSSVTSVENYSFYHSFNLINVELSTNTVNIGDYAFNHCNQLKKIYNTENLNTIGKCSFAICESLECIDLPETLLSIPDSAFYSCKNLKLIKIPNSVTQIGRSAFSFDTSLEKVYIGDKVKLIDFYAFEYCKNLSTVEISKNVTGMSIERAAFFHCPKLKSIFIPKGVTNIYSKGNVRLRPFGYMYDFDSTEQDYKKVDDFTIYGYDNSDAVRYALYADLNFVSLGKTPNRFNYKVKEDNTAEIYSVSGESNLLDIPETIDGFKVTSISENAFENVDRIKQVKIPSSIKNINSSAFIGCGNIKEFYVDSANEYYSSNLGVLYNKDSTKLICYPVGNESKEFIIPENVKVINDCSFYSAKNLERVIISNSVTNIRDEAFYNCKNLSYITLPNCLNFLGSSAFANCSKIESIKIPNGINQINSYTFHGCSLLNNIIIPDSVHSIEEGAFANCSNLSNLVFSNNLLHIGKYAFTQCTSLTKIVFPESLIGIDSYAFSNCKQLEVLKPSDNICDLGIDVFSGTLWETQLSDGLNYFGNVMYKFVGECPEYLSIDATTKGISGGAFMGCSSLVYIEIPDNISYIGEQAFCGCNNLINIRLPESLVKIDADTFVGCSNLNDINIPYSVSSIGNRAFMGCSNLERIVIPNSVKYIGEDAFNSCERLCDVSLSNNLKSISNGIFSHCYNLSEIVIPNGISEIKTDAFNSCSSLVSITLPYTMKLIEMSAFADCSNLSSAYFYGDNLKDINIDTFENEYLLSAKVSYLDYKLNIGDINKDGLVNIRDATMLQKYLADSISLSDSQRYVADIDGDGIISVKDVAKLQKFIVHNITTLS